MTAHHSSDRLAYEDPASPQELYADCRAAGENLSLPPGSRTARAALQPPPSIHFEDYPREVPKREIRVSDAAARLAGALHLHLD